MDIRFSCDRCGQHIAAEPTMIGQAVTCPQCQRALTVPAGSTLVEPPDIVFLCAHCRQSIAVPAAGAGIRIACPKCGRPLIVPAATAPAPGKAPVWLFVLGGAFVVIILAVGALAFLFWHGPSSSRAPETEPTAAPPANVAVAAAPVPGLWKVDGLAVTAVTFSPDGRWVGGCCGDGSVRIWDAPTGKEVQNHKVADTVFRCLAFSPDSRQLAAGANTGLIQFWAAETGAEQLKVEVEHDQVAGLLFSASGQTFVTIHDRENSRPANAVRVWDTATGRLTGAFLPQTDGLSLALLRRDGLVYVGRGDGLTVVNPDKAELVSQLDADGHIGFDACGVAVSPEGQHLVAAQQWGRAKVYDPQTLKPAGEFVIGAGRFRTDTPRSMCFSPDGKLLACGTGGDTAYLLNSADWKPVGTIQPNAACIAFSADGRFLLTAGSNGVELRDLKKCLAASGANR